MGTDINGSVEFREASLDEHSGLKDWWSVIDAGLILDRNYSLFGSLFGVRNRTDFVPIAPERGLPEDVSEEVRQEAETEGYHSYTWISWSELQAVNWEEAALDGLVHSYIKGQNVWHHGTAIAAADPRRCDGETWVEGGTTYKVERVTRRQALGDSGELLMELMHSLAKRYGDECVRLVVWFDN